MFVDVGWQRHCDYGDQQLMRDFPGSDYHLFFQFVFQSRIKELGARDVAAPLVLVRPEGGAEGGVVIELDAGGGLVQGLDSSNLVDHDK